MKKDTLLLLESMFLPDSREDRILARLIEASCQNRNELTTKLFWGQVEYLQKVLTELYGEPYTLDVDIMEFIQMIGGAKKTLLGKIRLYEGRELRRRVKNGENIHEKPDI